MQKKIIFYRTPSNRCPVEEILDELPGKVAQKIAWVLKLVEEVDVVSSTYFKKLEGFDIWECRISFASNAYRILCFLSEGNTVVLTHGFKKKTEKVPRTEIEKADNFRKEYMTRRKQ